MGGILSLGLARFVHRRNVIHFNHDFLKITRPVDWPKIPPPSVVGGVGDWWTGLEWRGEERSCQTAACFSLIGCRQ